VSGGVVVDSKYVLELIVVDGAISRIQIIT
jgi:hypothetical protein